MPGIWQLQAVRELIASKSLERGDNAAKGGTGVPGNMGNRQLLVTHELSDGGMTDLQEWRALKRAIVCEREETCSATCGRCRTRWARKMAFHESITDDEFEACMTYFRCRTDEAPHYGRPHYGSMRRYVHDVLRRRNEPYRGDTRLCIRMNDEELDALRREADGAGMTLQQYGRAMHALA